MLPHLSQLVLVSVFLLLELLNLNRVALIRHLLALLHDLLLHRSRNVRVIVHTSLFIPAISASLLVVLKASTQAVASVLRLKLQRRIPQWAVLPHNSRMRRIVASQARLSLALLL